MEELKSYWRNCKFEKKKDRDLKKWKENLETNACINSLAKFNFVCWWDGLEL